MRIGVDMGGTKILAAVVDEKGKVVARAKQKTRGGGNEGILAQLTELIEAVLANAACTIADIEAIGVAVPGPIDRAAGVVLTMTNVGALNLPLAAKLRERFDRPVTLENDVNAGTWGEFVAGAARGKRHVVGVFVGTGIGGGLILDGRLYRGARGAAGEIGHMVVQTDGRRCGCGGYGCLETVASKTAIARDLVTLAFVGQSPTLSGPEGTDLRKIKSSTIAKALSAGEAPVRAVVDQAARFLGIGLAGVVNVFEPEIIVLGGGLPQKLGSSYFNIVEATMRERAVAGMVKPVRLAPAKLGDDAGVIGAADLAVRESSGQKEN